MNNSLITSLEFERFGPILIRAVIDLSMLASEFEAHVNWIFVKFDLCSESRERGVQEKRGTDCTPITIDSLAVFREKQMYDF
jgi:hypothetical protein